MHGRETPIRVCHDLKAHLNGLSYRKEKKRKEKKRKEKSNKDWSGELERKNPRKSYPHFDHSGNLTTRPNFRVISLSLEGYPTKSQNRAYTNNQRAQGLEYPANRHFEARIPGQVGRVPAWSKCG